MSNVKAFPRPFSVETDGNMEYNANIPEQDGMLLIDYFAAKAMSEMTDISGMKGYHERVAQQAYLFAAAMLEERKKHVTE